jgi:hypothetical protein
LRRAERRLHRFERDLRRFGRRVPKVRFPLLDVVEFALTNPFVEEFLWEKAQEWFPWLKPGVAVPPTMQEIIDAGWTVNAANPAHNCSLQYSSFQSWVDWSGEMKWFRHLGNPGTIPGCMDANWDDGGTFPIVEMDWSAPEFQVGGTFDGWSQAAYSEFGVINDGPNVGKGIWERRYYARGILSQGDGAVPGASSDPVWRYGPLLTFPEPEPARFGDPITQPPGDVDGPAPWHHPDAATPTVDVPIMAVPVFGVEFPDTAGDPSPQPDTQEILLSSGTNFAKVKTRVGRPTNRRERNPRRVKERKIRMRGAALGVWHVINVVSEGLEFIDAMHKTLPRAMQAKPSKPGWPPTPYAKAEAVWHAFESDRFDLAKAVEAYVNEQMEDFIYGVTSVDAHANQLLNKPTGGGKFATQQQELLYEASGESPIPIPKLSFDVDSGDWSLDVGGYSIGGNLGRAVF